MKREEIPFFAGKEIPKEYLNIYFFDRKKEIEEIPRKLKNKVPVNIAMYGQRRIGKTSLLETISVKLEKECLPVFIKCEQLMPQTPQNFLSNLATELGTKLEKINRVEQIKNKTKEFLNSIKEIELSIQEITLSVKLRRELSEKELLDKVFGVIEKISKISGKKVIILFDEFHELFKFGNEFLWTLRAYISNSTASFVVASSYHRFKHKLVDEEHPFFNFFEIYHISPVPENEAIQYLKKRITRVKMSFSDEVIHKIISTSECKPFYLQLLASKCYDVALRNKENKINDHIFAIALNEALENAPAYETAAFANLKGNNKDVFVVMCLYNLSTPTKIAEKVGIAPKNVNVILKRIIDETGLIEKNTEGSYVPTNNFLKEYVRKQFSEEISR